MLTWKNYKQQLSNLDPNEMKLLDTLAQLQATRIKKRISLRQLSQASKMSVEHLKKLENLDISLTRDDLQNYAKGLKSNENR